MHNLVKIITSDDGEKRDKPVWCLVEHTDFGDATFCQAEFFGLGESCCEYKTKTVARGGITCERCLERIRLIKDIQL